MPAQFESGVTTRELSWHGEETHIADNDEILAMRERKALTRDEVLRWGNLDWTVHVTAKDEPEMYFFDGEKLRPVVNAEKRRIVFRKPGEFSLFDEPQDIASVGSKYEAFGNELIAEYAIARISAVEEIAEEPAVIESAMSLFSGRLVVVCIRTEDLLVGGADPVGKFFSVASSHDGTRNLEDFEHDTRIVCANTLAVALRQAQNKRSVKHTKSGKEFLENVVAESRASTIESVRYNAYFAEIANRMAEIDMSVDDFRKVVREEIYPAKNPSEPTDKETSNWQLTVGLFNSSDTLTGIPNTLWRGLNALTERDQHFGRTRTAKGTSPKDNAAEKALFQSGTFATKAWDILTAPIDMDDVAKKVDRKLAKRLTLKNI